MAPRNDEDSAIPTATADASDGRVLRSEVVGKNEAAETAPQPAGEQLSSPAKLMRIGSMIKQVLEEVRNADLDEESREQLRDMYVRSLDELQSALGKELGDELERISIDFGTEIPTEAQLRVAKAQLVGWMEGVFHGIQAALITQQVEARNQLEGIRSGIPSNAPTAPAPTGGPGYL